MICPICKKGETSVVDSRPTEDGTTITIDTDTGTIDELTSSSLIISQVDGGTTQTVTMEKVD